MPITMMAGRERNMDEKTPFTDLIKELEDLAESIKDLKKCLDSIAEELKEFNDLVHSSMNEAEDG